jgi:hypothetical protein
MVRLCRAFGDELRPADAVLCKGSRPAGHKLASKRSRQQLSKEGAIKRQREGRLGRREDTDSCWGLRILFGFDHDFDAAIEGG